MSWPMPTSGQWNPAMAMATPEMNIGSYTHEQWTALQQQNWQQWAQWQQQYAQWHNQYGDKYTEQMQAMQAMGGMPPLPPASSAPPPAPPPPDQPPPPPPHENNQPLYGQSQPSPVPAPQNNKRNANPGYNNANYTGKNQNWSYAADARPTSETTQPNVNAEALKKLAEEERLFDIQFQKWEDEIEKWKRENVNHPDKQAYKEYEQKFEACRAQLLERRQQMKHKRARLLGNTPQAANTTLTGNNNISTAIPPPLQTTNKNDNFNQNMQPQSFQNKPPNYSNQSNSQYYQYNDMAVSGYPSINKNKPPPQLVDPQNRYESYQQNVDYPPTNSDKSSFLPTSGSSKGIPGLDLVPEVDKAYAASIPQDVIDITEDHQTMLRPQGPDYTTISKGIDNILGDEKIMNILSMVRGQNAPPKSSNTNANIPSGPNPTNNLSMPPPNNHWDRNDNNYNNQQYGNRQNMPYNSQGPNYPMQQQLPVQKDLYDVDDRQGDMLQEQYYERNGQYGGQNMPPQSGPPPMRHNTNMPPPRPPLHDMSAQQNIDEYPRGRHDNNIPSLMSLPPPPVRQKWVEEPMFNPSLIVEYEHKPLRLKARDFIEPVHMFDYNHKSKDDEYKKKDFEKEFDDLYTRKPRRPDKDDDRLDRGDRFTRDIHSRDYERRVPREEVRDDYRPRVPPRDEYDDRRRPELRYEERRRDDREKYSRREDIYRERERERDRDLNRDRHRDYRREESRRSRSQERDSRKRARSKESSVSDLSKKSKENDPKQTPDALKHVVMIDDILEPPGREMRPDKIVIIMRGPPGSGKSYLAKLIRDREAEHGGTARIMSIDDYFMQEGEIEETDPTTGKIIKKPSLKYEYDASSEETYMNSLKRAFKRSLTDGYFTFLIYDAVNDHLKSYADIWNYARQYGFQVYLCTMELDPMVCYKRNIHNRKLEDIQVICSRFFPTPAHQIELDATTLLQNAAITDVHMEDASDVILIEDSHDEPEVDHIFTSKWEKMDDAAQLARLDGTSRPLRPSQLSMDEYLQLDDWTPHTARPGKKTVRWADIEERRQQDKMRAIGFVVGQTDWHRMTDPTMGSSALTQTKYIERVKRY